MRRRLALSALAMLFTATFAVTSNVTTESADSSAPQKDTGKYSLQANVAQANLGWGHAD
ncbi:hypothetical protein GCM10022252_17450 [Streptosporangium oxazolinicum]|uniref:Uncharacterized protein n=1 Tax=Streptosporangium oxazolinicum TaxID=909287 RepID=A0ABP8ALT2_9ACTN